MHKDKSDILIQATGALNNWRWPSIPGLHDFNGKLLHSASWDEEYDYTVCACTFYIYDNFPNLLTRTNA